ncbi:MAG TPA: hypothetical protein VF544_00585 [Pyrinomonadaceae bacterium]
MRRAFTLTLLLLTLIIMGCAHSSAPPDSSAPKAGSATAPAAKPSPSANDPAIKPPTKEHE